MCIRGYLKSTRRRANELKKKTEQIAIFQIEKLNTGNWFLMLLLSAFRLRKKKFNEMNVRRVQFTHAKYNIIGSINFITVHMIIGTEREKQKHFFFTTLCCFLPHTHACGLKYIYSSFWILEKYV